MLYQFVGIVGCVLLIYCIFNDSQLHSNLPTGVLAGLISAIIIKYGEDLAKHFSADAKRKRNDIKLCKRALKNLDNRFNISVSNNSSPESLVYITPDIRIWCLFEITLLKWHTTGQERYPDDDKFQNSAKEWFQIQESSNQLDELPQISESEMNRLLIEVNSWGESSIPWLLRNFPKIWQLKVNVSKWLYSKRDKNVIVCEYLFRDYKLPRGRAAQLNIELITGKPMT